MHRDSAGNVNNTGSKDVYNMNVELNKLIERAQKEPGIMDLSIAYEQDKEVLEKSREYLAGVKPITIVSTTSST